MSHSNLEPEQFPTKGEKIATPATVSDHVSNCSFSLSSIFAFQLRLIFELQVSKLIEPVGERNWIWNFFTNWFKAVSGKIVDTHIAVDHAAVCRVVVGCEEVDGEECGAAAGAVCEAGIVPAIPGMDHTVERMGGLQSYLQEVCISIT